MTAKTTAEESATLARSRRVVFGVSDCKRERDASTVVGFSASSPGGGEKHKEATVSVVRFSGLALAVDGVAYHWERQS
jgi:hypothetical protein